jgi:hypothetical protein
MMLPPAELAWTLEGTEAEFVFDYGYDPDAYARPNQGNGTELKVVFRSSGGSEEILFQRYLDPAHVEADRGRQSARIMLPDSGKGATLRVQTRPGYFNDTSWDWAYVGSTGFVRYPYFPLPKKVASKP